MFDTGGLAITADAAQAAIIRGLEPLATASRVADRSVSLVDLTGTVRTAGFDEIANSLALRGSDVVASAEGDAALLVVASRQGAIDRLVADGIEPAARARALVDDATLVVRAEFDDPAEFDRLRAIFQADQDATEAYIRFGDGIFDEAGSLIDDLVEVAGVCRVNRSFSADTLVALADGTLLEISDVQVGDQVLAWDLETGTAVSRTVTATLPHTDWLLEAHFSDGSVLEVTEDHRFWSTTDNDWVELQDLDTTDVLLTPDGATVTVDHLDWTVGAEAPAWDLTVDDVHNFFVAADVSAEPLLVHNAGISGFGCADDLSLEALEAIVRLSNSGRLTDQVAGLLLAIDSPSTRRGIAEAIGRADNLDDAVRIATNAVEDLATTRTVLAFTPDISHRVLGGSQFSSLVAQNSDVTRRLVRAIGRGNLSVSDGTRLAALVFDSPGRGDAAIRYLSGQAVGRADDYVAGFTVSLTNNPFADEDVLEAWYAGSVLEFVDDEVARGWTFTERIEETYRWRIGTDVNGVVRGSWDRLTPGTFAPGVVTDARRAVRELPAGTVPSTSTNRRVPNVDDLTNQEVGAEAVEEFRATYTPARSDVIETIQDVPDEVRVRVRLDAADPSSEFTIIPDSLDFLGVDENGVALFRYIEVKGSRLELPTIENLTDNQAVATLKWANGGPLSFTTAGSRIQDILDDVGATSAAISQIEIYSVLVR